MKVLYNALSTRTGGGFSYARDQVGALLDRGDLDLTVLTAPWNHDLWTAAGVPESLLEPIPVRSVPLRFAWEQVVLPLRARRYDVVLSPGNMGPLVCPVAHIVVLQNPNYAGAGREREVNRTLRRRAKIGFSHLAMRRADRVVAISEYLADQMAADPRLDRLEVSLVRSGSPAVADDHLTDEEAAERVATLVGDEPYLLSVANDYPHKRLEDLGRLVARLRSEDLALPRLVVFAGSISEPRRDAIRAAAGAAAGSLRFLGAVSDRRDVRALYRRSFAAVSVSDLEAWPLTLLEARSEGAPLVVTDIAPHLEIASGQATFFPAGDLGGLVKALQSVASDGPLPAWVPERSWDDHGAELADVLRDVVGG